jgi:hypothetical protein
MTTTLENLIDEVSINLAGYTLQQDRTTHITEPVTTLTSPSSDPTILALASTDSISKGIFEIGEELIWVDSFDKVAKTATIAPYGRGYLGSTAATHLVDSRVTISPTFPRHSIKRALNDTIGAFGATIMAVKTTTFTWNPSVNTYAFNDLNIKNILSLTWQSIGSSKEWIPIRSWDFDAIGDSTAFGAGAQTVTIGDPITSGRTVKVIYATDPTPFTANTQDYVEQTGLPSSTRDVAVLGATYRLLSALDPARAALTSPQADETDTKRPYGSSQAATKQIYALYQQRLLEESKAQQANFPIRVHYSRR